MESGVLILCVLIVRHKTYASVFLLLASLANASTHFRQTKVEFTLENSYHTAHKREVHRHPWLESSHGHNDRIHASNNTPRRGSSTVVRWRIESEEDREINGNQLSSPIDIEAVRWHHRGDEYQPRQKPSSEDDSPKEELIDERIIWDRRPIISSSSFSEELIDERRIWERRPIISSSTEATRQTELDESTVVTGITIRPRFILRTGTRKPDRRHGAIPIIKRKNGGY